MPKCPTCGEEIGHLEYVESIGGEYKFKTEELIPNDDSEITYICPMCGNEVELEKVVFKFTT
jgi:predicted RNA-binding Zn-ribbon protein involved in translation (DUF1610 family)